MEYHIARRTDSDELMHYGVKGMKWGVRRYQNKDGTLTPSGKKKRLMNDYASVGASKELQRSHGYDKSLESKLVKKASKSINRLNTGNKNPKYTGKQKAKDYETAIRTLNTLKGYEVTKSYLDADQIRYNENRITKLNRKKPSEKTLKKIKQLTTDNELMQLRMLEASEKYKAYENYTNQLINSMSKDSSVVYTTRYRTQASSGCDYGYVIGGTDYKVRANNKRRSKSSKYNDPKHKRQYDTKLNKYINVYI